MSWRNGLHQSAFKQYKGIKSTWQSLSRATLALSYMTSITTADAQKTNPCNNGQRFVLNTNFLDILTYACCNCHFPNLLSIHLEQSNCQVTEGISSGKVYLVYGVFLCFFFRKAHIVTFPWHHPLSSDILYEISLRQKANIHQVYRPGAQAITKVPGHLHWWLAGGYMTFGNRTFLEVASMVRWFSGT